MSAADQRRADAEDRDAVAFDVVPQPVGVRDGRARPRTGRRSHRWPAPPTISHGPMIQPKSANQNRRSPGRQSNWNAASSAIFTVKPPCTCTEPFGLARRARRVGDEQRVLAVDHLASADGLDTQSGHRKTAYGWSSSMRIGRRARQPAEARHDDHRVDRRDLGGGVRAASCIGDHRAPPQEAVAP